MDKSLFFLFTSLLLSSSIFVSADLIDDICNSTPNPASCSNQLRADSRSAGADLTTLATISIQISQTSAKNILGMIPSGSSRKSLSSISEIEKTCKDTYGDATDILGQCNQDVANRDWSGLNVHASSAIDDATTCDDAFMEGKVQEPANLLSASQNFQAIVSAILVIANRLGA